MGLSDLHITPRNPPPHTHTYAPTHSHTHTHTHLCTHTHTHTHTHTYTLSELHIYPHQHTYTHIHTHTHQAWSSASASSEASQSYGRERSPDFIFLHTCQLQHIALLFIKHTPRHRGHQITSTGRRGDWAVQTYPLFKLRRNTEKRSLHSMLLKAGQTAVWFTVFLHW